MQHTDKYKLDLIEKDAKVKVIPYGAITQKQDGRSALSDMDAMAPYVCAFSDDGKGVQTGALMEEAMVKAKELGKMIVAHCEDESLLHGGYIHGGTGCASCRENRRAVSCLSHFYKGNG